MPDRLPDAAPPEARRDPADRAGADARASEAALARYRAGLRRPRLVYAGVLSAIVAVVVAIVAVAYAHGEIAHTTLHTAARPPANLPVSTPAASERVAWSTADRAALGDPRYGGTVVVWGAHTVRGVDARTGRQTWSYTRTDRTVCAAVQVADTTVAVYELDGNCDEVTALQTESGQRQWTRTLDFNGEPLLGHPTYQATPDTVMIISPSVIYAIDPVSGYNRWTYSRFGCTIHQAVLGTAGALISQTCTDPQCLTEQYCARGPQLFLRDGVNSANDNSKTNPDLIHWNLIGNSDVPVAADGVVAAVNSTTRSLDVFGAGNGRVLSTVALDPAPSDATATATSLDGPELGWVGGTAFLVDPGGVTAEWARSAGEPTVVAPTPQSVLGTSTALVTSATATGAQQLDPATGRTTQTISLSPAPASGALVYPLGAGVLVASAGGTAAYT